MRLFTATNALKHLSILVAICSLTSTCEEVYAQETTELNTPFSDDISLSTTTIGHQKKSVILEGRAHSTVDHQGIKEQVTRSVPEALGDELGAYVQQTAHGQGSVYLRGRTGRHTLLMVDGFRLNHALFRQGPNQYLFTIDPLSINRIDVLRGGGAVRLGSNALSGTILVHSKKPSIDPYIRHKKINLTLTGLYASADLSRGLKSELDIQMNKHWGIYLSVGWLEREALEASGKLVAPMGTPNVLLLEKNVPRFEKNNRIQMGTGYKAFSTDIVSRLKYERSEWIIASRLFRQYDSPRTDQCPPPEAPETWCLNYDEQFRTHIYTTWQRESPFAFAQSIWLGLSFQRQHERRTNDRENYLNIGRDGVNIWEVRSKFSSFIWQNKNHILSIDYGTDSTFESVSSKAWDTLVRSDITRERTRGQYLEGSHYLRAGTWSELKWVYQAWTIKGGARYSYSKAIAPSDPQTESLAVDRSWIGTTLAGGLTWQLSSSWSLLANIEEGFAPPNLDDLTARQLTGQGFQIENPELEAESSMTTEVGTRYQSDWKIGSSRIGFDIESWFFLMRLYQGIERRDASCPMSNRSCTAARISTPFTLINLPTPAHVYGIEHQANVRLPHQITLSEFFSYAVGEGPSPLPKETGDTRPLSRIPPFNGGFKIRWDSPHHTFYSQVGIRWAKRQNRLSFGDEIDHRVPYGGTPQYQVYHAQLGLREESWSINLNLENISDTVYRVHGSSVNGAARGISLFITHNL